MDASKIQTRTGLEVKPIHTHFGVEVINFDFGRPVTEDAARDVLDLADHHLIVLFRGQHVTEAQHVAFTELLGPPIPPVEAAFASKTHPMILRLGNVDMDGNMLPTDDPATKYNDAAEDWHSDGSFKPQPNYLTVLHGLEVPPERGETWYASMAAAYEALPAEVKAQIADLEMTHPYPSGKNKVKDWEAQKIEPSVHPLVRTLPGGQKSLFLAHPLAGGQIVGMSQEDSDRLTSDLLKFATSGEFTYKHQWKLHDTLIWNNRGVIHSARGWDRARYRRLLQRTEISEAREYA